jgi:hypothetical protein
MGDGTAETGASQTKEGKENAKRVRHVPLPQSSCQSV